MIQNYVVFKLVGNQPTLIAGDDITAHTNGKDVVIFYADLATTYNVYSRYVYQKYFNSENVDVPPLKWMTQDDDLIDSVIPSGYVEDGYHLWYYTLPNSVTGVNNSGQNLPVRISFQIRELEQPSDYLGFTTTDETTDSLINAELKVAYPTAVTDNFVNVYETTSNNFKSWEFDGTDWVEQTTVLNQVVSDETLYYQVNIKPNSASETEVTDRDITDDIASEIAELRTDLDGITGTQGGLMDKATYDTDDNGIVDKAESLNDGTNVVTAAEAKDTKDYVDSIEAGTEEVPYANALKSGTTYRLDHDGSDFDTHNEGIKVGSLKLYNLAGDVVATGSFDGKDIVWSFTPDGTTGLVSGEMFKNLFIQVRLTANATEGQVIMFDGVIGASGKIKGKPHTPSGLNANPEYLLGVATQNGSSGNDILVNWFGAVNGIDTSGLTEGAVAYADTESADGVNDGGLTNTAPTAPNAQIRVGTTIVSSATVGVFVVRPDFGYALGELHDVYLNGGVSDGDILKYNGTTLRWEAYNLDNLNGVYAPLDILNGSFVETFDFLYNATTSEFELTNADGISTTLTMIFSDGRTSLDVTSLSIAPTFGSTTVEQVNYFYIPQSTKTLTKSTSGFPTSEHIKVAEIILLDEAYTDSNGALGNRNWNDHVSASDSTFIGALNHIRARLRRLGAKWYSGVAGATSGSWVKDTSGTLYFTSSAGVVLQLHPQTFPAKDTSVSDDMHIVNDFTNPYNAITTFNGITAYSDGSSIGNNDYFNVFVWGVVNKGGEYAPIMVNTPTAGYSNETDAKTDLDSTMVTTIPTAFRETAFAICRLVLKKTASAYVFVEQYDLREQNFGIGGTTGTGTLDGEFIDTSFQLLNVTDTSKVAKISAAGQATGTTVTVTWPDADTNMQDDILDPIATLEANKVDEDLINNYPSVLYTGVSDNGTTWLIVDDNGTPRRINLDNIYTGANVAAGSFSPDGDFTGDDLKSNEAAFIPLHTMTSNATNEYQVYASINAPKDMQIAWFLIPEITSTTYAEISTDNDTTYYNLVNVNGSQVNANVISEAKILAYYDATNTQWVLLEKTELTNDTLPYVGAVGAFNTPEQGVAIAIGAKSQVQVDDARGLTYEQLVSNGDFSDGTTDWTISASATGSVTDGIYSFTATAQYGRIQQLLSVVSGVTYLFKARVKSDSNLVYLVNPSGISPSADAHSGSGEYEILSYVGTATATGDITIQVSDYRTSSWTQVDVDYIMAIPVPTILASKTADELAQIFPRYIAQGVHRWGESGTYTASEYSTEMQRAIESMGFADGDTINGIFIHTTGDNLFDESKLIIGGFSSSTGIYEDTRTSDNCSLEFIKIINGKDYTLSTGDTGEKQVFYYSDNNEESYISREVQLDGVATSLTLTIPTNAQYVRIMYKLANNDYGMLNLGTSALDYVAYEDNVSWLNTNGINDIGGVYDDLDTQRTNTHALLSADMDSVTTGTNLQYVTIGLDAFSGIVTQTASTVDDTMLIEGFTEVDGLDVSGEENTFYTDASNLYLQVALGTYANLAAAQTALTGTDTTYVLATYLQRTEDNANLIEQRGALTITPYGQYNTTDVNGVAWKFFATSAISKSAQDELNRANDVAQEKKIKALQVSVDVAESDIDTLQSDLTTAEGEIDTLQTDVTNIETKTDFISVTESINLDLVAEWSLLDSTTYSAEITTDYASATTRTISTGSFTGATFLAIEMTNAGGGRHLHIIDYDLDEDYVLEKKTYGAVGMTNYICKFRPLTSTTFVLYQGSTISTTFGSPANVVLATSTSPQITAIYKIVV